MFLKILKNFVEKMGIYIIGKIKIPKKSWRYNMAALREQSQLYRTLDDMYKNNNSQDITEDFFKECIVVASKFSKQEIQFVLFKLRLLNENVDSGVDKVNNILNSFQKVLDVLTGKNLKKALITNVLEIVLSEK